MSRGPTRRETRVVKFILLAVISLLVASVPIAISLISGSLDDADQWVSLVSLGASLVALVACAFAITGGAGKAFRIREDRDAAAMSVVTELAELERVAKELLGERDGVSPAHFPFSRMRDGLVRLGIWTESDLVAFDTALRVRNKVAHGDLKTVSAEELSQALITVRGLREEILKISG